MGLGGVQDAAATTVFTSASTFSRTAAQYKRHLRLLRRAGVMGSSQYCTRACKNRKATTASLATRTLNDLDESKSDATASLPRCSFLELHRSLHPY